MSVFADSEPAFNFPCEVVLEGALVKGLPICRISVIPSFSRRVGHHEFSQGVFTNCLVNDLRQMTISADTPAGVVIVHPVQKIHNGVDSATRIVAGGKKDAVPQISVEGFRVKRVEFNPRPRGQMNGFRIDQAARRAAPLSHSSCPQEEKQRHV